MPEQQTKIILIAGPTASGKSSLALALSQAIDGEIVNADAMQVYQDLNIVSARPSEEETARVPHHLYGILDGAERCSAGRWARLATEAIEFIRSRHKVPIIVGGTGLYFRALTQGLSPIPDVDDQYRARARARHEELGPAAFHAEVIERDGAMDRLPQSDTQRLLRAWEVYEATGKPLSHFQAMTPEPLSNGPFERYVLAPPRDKLYAACDARAAAMFEEGAMAEIQTLLARDLDPNLPVMKALGVPEVAAYLNGAIPTQDEALAALQQNTRRFAKRQMTWFRNQTADWQVAETAEEILAELAGL